jgi:predicted KAP-like P-loop ATPase
MNEQFDVKSSVEIFVSADLPIERREEDRLNRRRFAESLAKVIRGWRDKPSLAIGLFGDWGSGKSSIKNMILETLKDDLECPTILEFSPWQISGQDTLAERFFIEIGNSLVEPDTHDDLAVKKRVARWKVYSTLLSVTASVARAWKLGLHPASPMAPFADAAVTTLDTTASVAKAGTEGIEAEAELEKLSLAEIKALVSQDLRRLSRPILVVLDDIDRLTKEEIRLTLQLVKANADFPNLIFLILAQKESVIKALEEVAPNKGADFLEKIIQVDFDIPSVNRKQLQRLLLDGLNELLSNPNLTSRFKAEYWSEIFPEIFPLFRNLRDVNRFLGSLAFHVEIFRNNDTFEVNPVDLIALETLRLSENNLYRRIAAEKEVLTYDERWLRENRREEDRLRLQSLVDSATPDRQPTAKKLIEKLFPPATTASSTLSSWAGTGASIDAAEQRWFRQLRVCSYQAFDRYFQFETPEGDVSQADIDAVTDHMGDQVFLDAFFVELVRRDLLEVMLARLNSLKEKLSLEHASTFLAALYEVNPTHKLYPFFEPSPERHISSITYWYLHRLSENERLTVMQAALEKTGGIGFATRTVGVLTSSPEQSSRTVAFLTAEADREALKQACLQRILQVASKDYELQPQDFRMLRFWAAWDNSTARAWLSGYLTARERVVRFLNSAVHMSGENPKTTRYISLEVIGPMLSREELQSRIAEFFQPPYNEQEAELVNLMEVAKNRGPLGPAFDPEDPESDD